MKFDAQASAVALTEGASYDVAYKNGVAVFTNVKGGLMLEASIGGQHFSYKEGKKAEKKDEAATGKSEEAAMEGLSSLFG